MLKRPTSRLAALAVGTVVACAATPGLASALPIPRPSGTVASQSPPALTIPVSTIAPQCAPCEPILSRNGAYIHGQNFTPGGEVDLTYWDSWTSITYWEPVEVTTASAAGTFDIMYPVAPLQFPELVVTEYVTAEDVSLGIATNTPSWLAG